MGSSVPSLSVLYGVISRLGDASGPRASMFDGECWLYIVGPLLEAKTNIHCIIDTVG